MLDWFAYATTVASTGVGGSRMECDMRLIKALAPVLMIAFLAASCESTEQYSTQSSGPLPPAAVSIARVIYTPEQAGLLAANQVQVKDQSFFTFDRSIAEIFHSYLASGLQQRGVRVVQNSPLTIASVVETVWFDMRPEGTGGIQSVALSIQRDGVVLYRESFHYFHVIPKSLGGPTDLIDRLMRNSLMPFLNDPKVAKILEKEARRQQ